MMRILTGMACILALSGCEAVNVDFTRSVPYARHFPLASEQMVASAEHWQVIAGDVASSLQPAIGNLAYVRVPTGGSQFERAFGDMLATSLSEKGVLISRDDPGAAGAQVSFSVHVVRHNRGSVAHPGRLVSLATDDGIAVWSSEKADKAVDIKDVLPASPSTEIVVTVAAARNGADVARKTTVYFVAPYDTDKFMPPPAPPSAPGRLIEIRGER